MIGQYLRACLPLGACPPCGHRTALKCTVNSVLRLVQLWRTDRPWLLASVFEGDVWTGRYVWARVRVSR